MSLGFCDVSFSLHGVGQSRGSVINDSYEVVTLFMHLGIDLFGDWINVSHKQLYVIQLILSFLNYILHLCWVGLDLLFLDIKLLIEQRHLIVLLDISSLVTLRDKTAVSTLQIV